MTVRMSTSDHRISNMDMTGMMYVWCMVGSDALWKADLLTSSAVIDLSLLPPGAVTRTVAPYALLLRDTKRARFKYYDYLTVGCASAPKGCFWHSHNLAGAGIIGSNTAKLTGPDIYGGTPPPARQH
jgi:hypothetical protein